MADFSQKIDRHLLELKSRYTKYVINNPDSVAQLESAFRIISFLIAGRIENGELLSELMYSASNLIVFLNDNVFKAASKCLKKNNFNGETLQRWLTVLEYVEVFLEMAAKRKWGTQGAWVIICIIQIVKTVFRVYLFLRHDSGIQTSPAIPLANRELLKADQEDQHDTLEDAMDEDMANSEQENTFELKSSGRKIRTLKSAHNNGLRNWTMPQAPQTAANQKSAIRRRFSILNQPATNLSKRRKWAECLHIARPLAHLLAMYSSGQECWKPFLLALGMDVSSLMLMGDTKDLTVREKTELKHRTIMLLYYLMRSPFYDSHTKAKLVAFLNFLGNNVPLAGFIARPILEYLPAWQQMYFYVWAS